MEADWEVELGREAPVIDVVWTGFVDLQQHPERIHQISESACFPRLAAALLRLNAQTFVSGDQNAVAMQTIKCDLWLTGSCDPYEMAATPATSVCGVACYIDLVPRRSEFFPSLPAAESWARLVVERLRTQFSQASRVDLIVRQAATLTNSGFGVTAYISACGVTLEASEQALGRALDVFSETVTARKIPTTHQP